VHRYTKLDTNEYRINMMRGEEDLCSVSKKAISTQVLFYDQDCEKSISLVHKLFVWLL